MNISAVEIEGLKPGCDYTVAYKQDLKSMTGTATIKGKGNYAGTIIRAYPLERSDISSLTLLADDVIYTGKPGAIPKLSVYDTDGKLLKVGTDYIIAGYFDQSTGSPLMSSDILEPGSSIIARVEGIGMYYGTLEASCSVRSASIAKASVKIASQQYTGDPIELSKSDIILLLNRAPLDGDSYEIIGYLNNTAKGKATVILRGTGSYGGIKLATFKIDARKLG